MNSYYFDRNDEDTKKLFESEEIALSGNLKTFVERISEFVASEYNLSFLQFMKEVDLSCWDLKELLSEDSETDPAEFARIALEEYESNHRRSTYTSLVLNSRKTPRRIG